MQQLLVFYTFLWIITDIQLRLETMINDNMIVDKPISGLLSIVLSKHTLYIIYLQSLSYVRDSCNILR